MCKHTHHRVEAEVSRPHKTVDPRVLRRYKRLTNLVSQNDKHLRRVMNTAKREVEKTTLAFEKDPDLMVSVVRALTGRPILDTPSNKEPLTKFYDNIGRAYKLGLDDAPGTPNVVTRMIEDTVRDSVQNYITRLDRDTRTEIGDTLTRIMDHNRDAEVYDRLMPRDIARELSKTLDGNVARAEMISRTETMRSANLAGWAQSKSEGATHYTVDSSFEACSECADNYEGEVFVIDDMENLPPLHPNCACVPLFFMSEEDAHVFGNDFAERNEEERLAEEDKGKVISPDGSGAYYPDDGV